MGFHGLFTMSILLAYLVSEGYVRAPSPCAAVALKTAFQFFQERHDSFQLAARYTTSTSAMPLENLALIMQVLAETFFIGSRYHVGMGFASYYLMHS